MSRVTRSTCSSTAFGASLNKQVRFVEQKDELGLIEVADFGKPVEQFGQQPKQERRVEARRIHQLLGGENIDDAASVGRELHEIHDVESRLAEELGGALLFEHEQPALDDADRRRRDVSVFASAAWRRACPSRR